MAVQSTIFKVIILGVNGAYIHKKYIFYRIIMAEFIILHFSYANLNIVSK